MHKNLWRCPGSVWFFNCAYSKCIFLVRKVCCSYFRGMVLTLRVEMYRITQRLSHCFCKQNYMIILKKQPRPLADTRVNITLTLPWDGAPPRKGSPGGEKPRKRDSSLSGHWMGHLLSYSLSGGHDSAMLPINPRGLNGPLTSHFIFSSHMYFSLNTPTHYWSPMPN